MKKALVVALSVVLSVFISACSKGDDKKSGNSAPVSPQSEQGSLSNKSVEEVLSLKYDRVEFKCALWVQINHALNLEVAPNDSFVVDLKNGFTWPQTLHLAGEIENHKLDAKFELNSLSILAGLRHVDVDGTTFTALNSPTIEYAITAKGTTSFIYSKGVNSFGFYESKHESRERIHDVILNESTAIFPVNQDGVTIDRGAYRNYIECTLETEIKPEYQDEFKIEKKN